MSEPVDPHRGDVRRPYPPYGQQQRGQQGYGEPWHGGQNGQAGHGPYQQGWAAEAGQEPEYRQPAGATGHRQPAGTIGYRQPAGTTGYRQPAGATGLREPAAPRWPRVWRRPGLVLTIVGLAVLVLSSTILPWVRLDGVGGDTVSLPQVWRVATEDNALGFGGWYVTLLSYPLAALGVLLALASVLESAALKVIWGGLAVLGLGALVLRYGLGPLAGLTGGTGEAGDNPEAGLHLTTMEATVAGAGIAALVVVIFILRTAVANFRRLAGVILLVTAGLHGSAVLDLGTAPGAEQLGVGAYAPALGYLLTALAAFVGPRRLPIG